MAYLRAVTRESRFLRDVLAAGSLAASLLLFSCKQGGEATPAAKSSAPPQVEAFKQDVAWSPDGEWLAYSEYRGAGEYRPEGWAVHVVRADGSAERVLVENAFGVSWSPMGDRVAFGSGRDGDPEIYTIAADGTDLRRVTQRPGKDQLPAWSPDGSRIAFCSERDGNLDIFVVAPDGTGEARVTSDPAKDYNPAWSRDGERIVFFRERGDGKDQIHSIGADGKEERAITSDDANNIFPSFLPDGRIAFVSARKGEKEKLVRVGSDGGGREVVAGVETFYARWSPDGRRIAFVAGEWPRSSLLVAEANGGGARRIAQ